MSIETDMLRHDIYGSNGVMYAPKCKKCGEEMKGDGGCSEGCCDDWLCPKCGYRFRSEAPD